MKPKPGSLERLTKLTNLQAVEQKKVIRIRNERENITTNLTEVKRILKEYYEQVHANKLGILDEMGKFLERHK